MNANMTELPLKDIHLPDPISFWPLAIGWWAVLGIIICLLLLSLLVYRKLSKTTLKSQARINLKNIENNFLETDDATTCIKDISALLRRIIVSKETTKKAAGLTGKEWLKTLDQPLKTSEFSEGAGRILLTGPYSSHVDKNEVIKLINLTIKWVNAL